MPPFPPTLRLAHPRLPLHFGSIHHAARTARAVRPNPAATFSTTSILPAKNLPPRLVIPETDIEENFLKGSGPGGQKINKTSSAVQLKHLPTGIVVKYQDTRSRSLNRKAARRILGEKVEELEKGEDARTRVKAREKSRKKASADKKKRRKYRAIAGGKEGKEEDVEDVEDGLEEGGARVETQHGELEGEVVGQDHAKSKDTEGRKAG